MTSKLPLLEKLILNNNRMDAAKIEAFATAITAGALQSLKHLNLSDSFIGNQELQAFAEAVKQKGALPSLQHFNLAGNAIDMTGLRAFAEVVKQQGVLPSLKHLIISSDYVVYDEIKLMLKDKSNIELILRI